jgi:hypothetical protein
LEFQKDGVLATATFDDSKQPLTNVRIHYGSNYDLRGAPKLRAANLKPEIETQHSLVYSTEADLLSIECGLLRSMNEAGWITANCGSRNHLFSIITDPARTLNFIKNGVLLWVAVGQPDRKTGATKVEYVRQLMSSSVPFPPDTALIELDGYNFTFDTLSWMSISDLKSHFDRELENQGWIALSPPSSSLDTRSYVHNLTTIRLSLGDNQKGVVLIRTGDVGSSWMNDAWRSHNTQTDIYQPSKVYFGYAHWIRNQRLEPDFHSIDRFEAEMRSLLEKSR